MEKGGPLNLFIASAGLGTRLRPVTDAFPKPLLPMAGLPLVERLLYSAQTSLQIQDFAMNLHYRPEAFEAWAETLPPDLPHPQFVYEEKLLGTGGAISNAWKFFKKGACLLINGDILTDIDWGELVEHHRQSGNMVTLAVQDRSHERRVGVDAEGRLLCIDPEMKTPGVHRWLGYACATVYEPEFLEYLPKGESHVPPFWVKAAEQTGRVGTFDIGPGSWIDLGNVDSYAAGVLSCLCGGGHQRAHQSDPPRPAATPPREGSRKQSISTHAENQQSPPMEGCAKRGEGSSAWVSPGRFFAEPLNIPWDTRISGTCVIEKNVTLGSGVELCDSILLPGAVIEEGEKLNSVIAGPGFRESFWKDGRKKAQEAQKAEPVLSGSDRAYTRVADGMLMEYTAFETMVERQIALTEILRRNNLPVPEVISHSPAKRQVLLQDLGDESLQIWCKKRSDEEIEPMLKTVLDRLVDFQWADTSGASVPGDKPFSRSVLRWESSYFLERCVYRVFGLKEFCLSRLPALEAEFDQLAERVAALPRHLMHRDFQSSNVMIVDGEPWLIDFQDARHGPCFYDAASMIGDPYLDLPTELRRTLETYYLTNVSNRLRMSTDDCRAALILCGMQRHMQALGAYGFLSSIRGKTEFLQFIPPALKFLREEVSSVSDQFPVLNQLVDTLLNNE